jgi:hypothetical protein
MTEVKDIFHFLAIYPPLLPLNRPQNDANESIRITLVACRAITTTEKAGVGDVGDQGVLS